MSLYFRAVDERSDLCEGSEVLYAASAHAAQNYAIALTASSDLRDVAEAAAVLHSIRAMPEVPRVCLVRYTPLVLFVCLKMSKLSFSSLAVFFLKFFLKMFWIIFIFLKIFFNSICFTF